MKTTQDHRFKGWEGELACAPAKKLVPHTSEILATGLFVWLVGRFVAFRTNGLGFEFHSSRHVGTLGKSFTRSCRWCFGVELQHSIHAVLEAPLSSSVLCHCYRN